MKRILSWFIKGLPGILLSFSCLAQNATAIQDSAFYFKSNLPPEKIKITLQNAAFSKVADNRFNFGFTSDAYCYIVLKIKMDQQPGSYVLSIDNTSLDTVQVYSLLPDGSKKLLYRGGNLVRYDVSRNYVWHTFALEPGHDPHFYLIAVKGLSKNVNLQYRIQGSDKLQMLYRRFDRAISFYTGITLFIILISLLAFLVLKNKGLLLYVGYLISVTTWILSHYGYFFPWFYPSFPRINDVIKIVSSLLAVIFFLSLILYLFKNDIRSRALSRVILGLIGINTLFIGLALAHLLFIFSPPVLTFINITWHVLLVLSACAAVPFLFSLFSASWSAKIFCIAAACPFMMLFIQIFSNAGYISSSFLSDHGVLLANLLEIIIMLLGIIYNIWDKEKLKDVQLRLLEEDRKETFKKLITVQDSERKRIAEELHDSIGPMLAAIKINFLRSIKAERERKPAGGLIAKTESIIDESISEIRNIAHQLMPKGLSSKGLVTLLTEYFDDLENLYSADIHFTSDITATPNSDIQLNLYRIISELVLNAAKHGGAKVISVSLETHEDGINIIIRDDGTGFNAMKKSNTGMGLKSIESRVSYLKGNMEIQSSPGAGSCIDISILPIED
jgi:signal transduction histidine kinase